MAKKTISFSLSEDSINQAINELTNYKKEIEQKTILFQQKVANRISQLAQASFSGALADEYTYDGSSHTVEANVLVEPTHSGNVSIIVAYGKTAVWAEFGTGVTNNSTLHPWATELGFTPGSFGEGRGKNKKWYFYPNGEKEFDENNKAKAAYTSGVKATMPMANAVTVVLNEIYDIAKEVFG